MATVQVQWPLLQQVLVMECVSYSWLGTKSALSLPALGVSPLLLVFLKPIYSLVPLQNSPQIIQWNDPFSAGTLIHVP